MTDALRDQIFKLQLHRVGVNEIARRLGIWPNSVRWVLKRGELLKRERAKRVAAGAVRAYSCSRCHEEGHTAPSCGIARTG